MITSGQGYRTDQCKTLTADTWCAILHVFDIDGQDLGSYSTSYYTDISGVGWTDIAAATNTYTADFMLNVHLH